MEEKSEKKLEEKLKVITEGLKIAQDNLAKVIIGQEEAIQLALVTIFAGGHALLEGVPGIAKTLMVKALSKIFATSFNRIQFTPDLMPSDITGTNIFNLKTSEFSLVRGPVFSSFVLADEINRAPAKTQAALLQAMQEKQVSIDGKTYILPKNFIVFATQNPIEFEGTYSLPEAMKDRFLVKINVAYPKEEDEITLISNLSKNSSPEQNLEKVLSKPVLNEEVLTFIKASLNLITVKDELVSYIVRLIRKTREFPPILLGGSPRASQALLTTSRVLAVLRNRNFVTPDDIKDMAKSVLAHRLILKPEYEIEGLKIEEVIGEIIKKCEVPR
ncbi:MAG: MoxR family ATPase [bacterium]